MRGLGLFLGLNRETSDASALGRTWYFAPAANGGSNANDGRTSATPLNSNAFHVALYDNVLGNTGVIFARPLEAGDQLLFLAGVTHVLDDSLFLTRTCPYTVNNSVSDINPPRPGAPLVIGPYGGAIGQRATLDVSAVASNKCIDMYEYFNDLVIRDLELVGDSLSTGYGIGSIVTNESPRRSHGRVYIDNCLIRGFRRGIYSIGYPYPGASYPDIAIGFTITDVKITNCTVHSCGDTGIILADAKYGLDQAFPAATLASWTSSGFLVSNCLVYNIDGMPGYGNGIIVVANNSVIEYCEAHTIGFATGGPIAIWMHDTVNGVIRHCEAYNIKSSNGVDGGGFDLGGGCQNCVIEYCYVHDCDGAGLLLAATSRAYDATRETYGNHLRYNIVERGALERYGSVSIWSAAGLDARLRCKDSYIYNNLLYHETAGRNILHFTAGEKPTGIIFANNLCITTNAAAFIGNDVSIAAANVLCLGNLWRRIDVPGTVTWIFGGVTYTSLAALLAAGEEHIGGVLVGKDGDPLLSGVIGGGAKPRVGPYNLSTGLTRLKTLIASACNDGGINLPTDLLPTVSLARPTLDWWNATIVADDIGVGSLASSV